MRAGGEEKRETVEGQVSLVERSPGIGFNKQEMMEEDHYRSKVGSCRESPEVETTREL